MQFTPLTFHTVRGKHIALTHAYTVAERHAGEYACGYVFTSRPLELNEKIVIQVVFEVIKIFIEKKSKSRFRTCFEILVHSVSVFRYWI